VSFGCGENHTDRSLGEGCAELADFAEVVKDELDATIRAQDRRVRPTATLRSVLLEVICCLGRNYPAKGREQIGTGGTRSNKLRPEISSEVPPRAQAWLTARWYRSGRPEEAQVQAGNGVEQRMEVEARGGGGSIFLGLQAIRHSR